MSRPNTKRIALLILVLSLVISLNWLHHRKSPAVAYRITDLGSIPGATNSQGGTINASGEVTGRMFWAGNASPSSESFVHAFLWRHGQMTDLETLPGLPDSKSGGLNNRGQIVGYSEKSGMRPIKNGIASYHTCSAFTFQNGKLARLPTLPGYPNSAAYALNDSGEIVGADYPKYSQNGHAFLYSHGVLTNLGLLPKLSSPYASSEAVGINQQGTIVGTATDAAGFDIAFRAFLYCSGKMTDLGTLPGYADSSAKAINDNGQITGYVAKAGPSYPGINRAFLWQNGVMKELGTLPGYRDSCGEAINSHGDVVGFAASLPPLRSVLHEFLYNHFSIGEREYEFPPRPFLYAGGKMQDLNDLISMDSGWVLESASGINDTGQIVGTGLHHGQRRAFVLTPLHP